MQACFSQGYISGEVQQLKDLAAKTEEFRAAAISGTSEIHGDGLFDSPRTLCHDEDPIAHVNRFIDIVGDQECGSEASLPETQDFILHSHAGKGVEGA